MDEHEALADGLSLLGELLFEDLLEPNPARSDWRALEGRVQLVASTVRKSVLDNVPAGLAPDLGTAVATSLGRAGALLFAAGDKFGSDRLLSRAAEIAPS